MDQEHAQEITSAVRELVEAGQDPEGMDDASIRLTDALINSDYAPPPPQKCRGVALTDDQVGRLSYAIAERICDQIGGMGHHLGDVVQTVADILSGTPYEVG